MLCVKLSGSIAAHASTHNLQQAADASPQSVVLVVRRKAVSRRPAPAFESSSC